MSYGGKNILITGGLGFIGSNLAIKLVGLGANVEIVDSELSDCGSNHFNISSIRDDVKIYAVNIGNIQKMEPILKDKHYIFNLAGKVSHLGSVKNPIEDLKNNYEQHVLFLNACVDINPDAKIVYSSTRQVYGNTERIPVSEKFIPLPIDPNGIHKLATEHYHMYLFNSFKVKTAILRLTNTYGPRQMISDPNQGFIPWFVKNAITGEKIVIYGDGMQIRDFNYVDDVVDALLMTGESAQTSGKVLNLGGEAYSLKKFADILSEVTGSGKTIYAPFPQERKVIDIQNYQGDFSRINILLGWKPTFDLREGLKKTVEYYQTFREHYL